MSNNIIQWYENAAFDKPELRSPQPCPRGVYCQYKIPNPETKVLEIACCRMVHPGEEGNGRRLFPARNNGRQQPACVRLTGNAGFYERCRLKQPWRVWAAAHEIPLPPADVPWVPVTRGPIQRGPAERGPTQRGFDTNIYSEEQIDAFRHIAEYNDQVSGVSAAPDRWPSLQGSSGVKIAYEGSGPQNQAEQEHLDEQQRRVDAAYAQNVVIQTMLKGTSPIPAPIYFTPQPPPRLDLRPQLNINYGFSAAERFYDECSTPSLLTPVLDETLRTEGAMDAID